MATETIDRIGDGWLSGQPNYRTDLDRCTPADALSGVMLLAGPETAAPTITYLLGVRGLHAVSIGVLPISRGRSPALVVLLKRSGDETFTVVSLPPQSGGGHHGQQIVEMFWRITDLTGHDLNIGQICARVAPLARSSARRHGWLTSRLCR